VRFCWAGFFQGRALTGTTLGAVGPGAAMRGKTGGPNRRRPLCRSAAFAYTPTGLSRKEGNRGQSGARARCGFHRLSGFIQDNPDRVGQVFHGDRFFQGVTDAVGPEFYLVKFTAKRGVDDNFRITANFAYFLSQAVAG